MMREENERNRQHDLTRDSADRDWRSREREAGDTENQRNRDWQSGEARTDREFSEAATQRRNREGLGASILQNIMQNPEYMRDPNAAAGMIDYYLGEWDRWYPGGSAPTGRP